MAALYAGSAAGDITVRQLLAHTSGLADVPPRYTDPFWPRDARRQYTPTEFAREWIPGQLASAPGSFRYNNNGSYLLGLIVETATGQSYAENLKRHVLEPAGMRASGVFDGRTVLPKLTQGTVRTDAGERELPQFIDPSVSYAAAGLYSTAQDLLHFGTALTAGRLLGHATQREMFTDRGKGHGYDWNVEDWAVRPGKPLPVVQHTGSVPGYQSMLVRSPSDRVTVIILDNAWRGATVVSMARDIADLVHGKAVSLPRRSVADALGPVLFRDGLESMRAEYARLRAGDYDMGESAWNGFGYTLLRKGRIEAAVQVFRWNVALHPASPNVYDSLGEALLASGDRDGARAAYARVLALEPGNRHAAEALEGLQD